MAFFSNTSERSSTRCNSKDQFDNDDVALEETLVREVVQNSLDAAMNDKDPVIVTFNWITRESGLQQDFFEQLFEEQIDQAKESRIDCSKKILINQVY